MILTFADKPTKTLWDGKKPPELPPKILKTAHRKLSQINQSATLNDLRIPPGNRLEALLGDRAGQYSIRINDQYRVCFRWKGENAYDVEIADYH
jgi:toxin HigB-1